MATPLAVEWLLGNDPSRPVSQGDLLYVAWAKTIPSGDSASNYSSHPTGRDEYDIPYWDEHMPNHLGMAGRASYGFAIVVMHDCAIDKEFNILFDLHQQAGKPMDEARQLAAQEAEPFISVAEVWPLELYPKHLQSTAASGAMGYLAFTLKKLAPNDNTTYIANLNHIMSISYRAIDRRIGIADARLKTSLQSALCRNFAARNIRITEELVTIFNRTIRQVEALAPPKGMQQRQHVRFHFDDGTYIDVEAVYQAPDNDGPDEITRPGLIARRE